MFFSIIFVCEFIHSFQFDYSIFNSFPVSCFFSSWTISIKIKIKPFFCILLLVVFAQRRIHNIRFDRASTTSGISFDIFFVDWLRSAEFCKSASKLKVKFGFVWWKRGNKRGVRKLLKPTKDSFSPRHWEAIVKMKFERFLQPEQLRKNMSRIVYGVFFSRNCWIFLLSCWFRCSSCSVAVRSLNVFFLGFGCLLALIISV